MATYVNDLRLKEISTGDESGTWGTSTNTNLELIGEALGYATEQSFGSDADATTTVADGVSDPARAMYFKVTSAGNLTATRTLTIAPNTVSRVMFIENATSGSQSIAISQGSGANVTIATGKTAIVYLDGAGSGAAVVDAMAGVDPGVTDTLAEVLTAGNATGGTDIAVGTGDDVTFADSSKAIFGAGSDLQIYHDGSNSYITEQGTGQLLISTNGTTIDLLASGAEYMARFVQNGQSEIYYDSAKKLETTSTGIDVTGSVVSDGLTVDGVSKLKAGSTSTPADTAAFISNASAKLVVNHGNEYGAYVGYANSSNDAIGIQSTTSGGTTAPLSLNPYGGDVGIGTNSPNSYLAEGSNLVVADSGHAGITLASGTTSEGGIFFADGTSGSDRFRGMIRYNHTSNYMEFRTDAGERMRIDSSGNVNIGTTSAYGTNKLSVNGGVAIDGRNASTPGLCEKGDTDTGIFWPAANSLSVTTGGTERFNIDSSGNATVKAAGELRIRDDGTFIKEDQGLQIGNTSGTGTTRPIRFFTESAERMRIDSSGNVGIGTSPDARLRVNGTAKIGEGAASNTAKLMVNTASGVGAGIQLFQDGNESWIIENPASTTALTFDNSGAERMRIDSSGNVGIGTTNPASLLTIQDATPVFEIDSTTTSNTATIQFTSSGTVDSKITHVGNTGVMTIDSGRNSSWGGKIAFVTDTVERMRIDNSGNVGIGTASPGNFQLNISGSGDGGRQLKVEGPSVNGLMRFSNSTSQDYSIGINSTSFIVYDDTANSYRMVVDSSGNLLLGKTSASATGSGTELRGTQVIIGKTSSGTVNGIYFNHNSTYVGGLNYTDSATSLVTSSDERLKESIADADDAGSKIDAMQVRKFDWKADGSHQEYGFVAQELEPVFGHAVHTAEDDMQTKSVDYASLVPMLVKEIQSLRNRVAQLENS